jgi:hypothetical protein
MINTVLKDPFNKKNVRVFKNIILSTTKKYLLYHSTDILLFKVF